MLNDPTRSMFFESLTVSKNTQGLFNELVSRHDHLREALFIRGNAIKAEQNYPALFDKSLLLRIRESVLWFLTVEFYSRFLSDPSKTNNSKRCLLGLINQLDDEAGIELKKKYDTFRESEKEVLGYIQTQRSKYFAHADDIGWEDFPKVFDTEYERLLNKVADLLDLAGKHIGTQRICGRHYERINLFNQPEHL